jgi:hypothetical protein
MVRQKSRWLVVRFDFEENVKARTNAPGNTIDKKLIYFALQEVIYETFGIVQAGIIEDLQGKTQVSLKRIIAILFFQSNKFIDIRKQSVCIIQILDLQSSKRQEIQQILLEPQSLY